MVDRFVVGSDGCGQVPESLFHSFLLVAWMAFVRNRLSHVSEAWLVCLAWRLGLEFFLLFGFYATQMPRLDLPQVLEAFHLGL